MECSIVTKYKILIFNNQGKNKFRGKLEQMKKERAINKE